MSNQPYMSSPEAFNEAVQHIIDAVLLVASGRSDAPCYVFLAKKSGEIVVAPMLWDEKDDILLWKVTNPSSIGDIKTMIYESKGAPFYGDSWVEWYLKSHFAGVIDWNFPRDVLSEARESLFD